MQQRAEPTEVLFDKFLSFSRPVAPWEDLSSPFSSAPGSPSSHSESSNRKRSHSESTDSEDANSSKKARRRKQNRVAAQTSREKKKRYLTGLELQVQQLTEQNKNLQSRLQSLEHENRRLLDDSKPKLETYQAFDLPSDLPSPPLSKAFDLPCPLSKTFSDDTMLTCAISTKKEPTIFESAVFSFPQQSEMVALFVLLIIQVARSLSNQASLHSSAPSFWVMTSTRVTMFSKHTPMTIRTTLLEKKWEKQLPTNLRRPAHEIRKQLKFGVRKLFLLNLRLNAPGNVSAPCA